MVSQIGLKITLRPTKPSKMHTGDEGNTYDRLRIWYTAVDDPTSATTTSALPSGILTVRFPRPGLKRMEQYWHGSSKFRCVHDRKS